MPERVTSAETTSRGLTVPSALSSRRFKAESSLWQFTPLLCLPPYLPLSTVLWGSRSYSPLPGPSMSKHEWVQSKPPPSPTHTLVLFFLFLPLSFLFPSDAQVPSPLHDWPSLTSGNHRDPTGKRWRAKKTLEMCTLQLSVSSAQEWRHQVHFLHDIL